MYRCDSIKGCVQDDSGNFNGITECKQNCLQKYKIDNSDVCSENGFYDKSQQNPLSSTDYLDDNCKNCINNNPNCKTHTGVYYYDQQTNQCVPVQTYISSHIDISNDNPNYHSNLESCEKHIGHTCDSNGNISNNQQNDKYWFYGPTNCDDSYICNWKSGCVNPKTGDINSSECTEDNKCIGPVQYYKINQDTHKCDQIPEPIYSTSNDISEDYYKNKDLCKDANVYCDSNKGCMSWDDNHRITGPCSISCYPNLYYVWDEQNKYCNPITIYESESSLNFTKNNVNVQNKFPNQETCTNTYRCDPADDTNCKVVSNAYKFNSDENRCEQILPYYSKNSDNISQDDPNYYSQDDCNKKIYQYYCDPKQGCMLNGQNVQKDNKWCSTNCIQLFNYDNNCEMSWGLPPSNDIDNTKLYTNSGSCVELLNTSTRCDSKLGCVDTQNAPSKLCVETCIRDKGVDGNIYQYNSLKNTCEKVMDSIYLDKKINQTLSDVNPNYYEDKDTCETHIKKSSKMNNGSSIWIFLFLICLVLNIYFFIK